MGFASDIDADNRYTGYNAGTMGYGGSQRSPSQIGSKTSVSSSVGNYGADPTNTDSGSRIGSTTGTTSRSGAAGMNAGSGTPGGTQNQGSQNQQSSGSPGGTQNQGSQNQQTASGFQGAQGLGGGVGFQGSQFGRIGSDPGVGGVPGGIQGRGTTGNHPITGESPGSNFSAGRDPTNTDSGRRIGALDPDVADAMDAMRDDYYSPGLYSKEPDPFGPSRSRAKISDVIPESTSPWDHITGTMPQFAPFTDAFDNFLSAQPQEMAGILGPMKDPSQLTEDGPLTDPYNAGIQANIERQRELARELNRTWGPQAAPEMPGYEPPAGYQNPSRSFPQRRTGKIQDSIPPSGLGPGRTATPNIDLPTQEPNYDPLSSLQGRYNPPTDMGRRQVGGDTMLDAMVEAQTREQELQQMAREQAVAEEAARRQAISNQDAYQRSQYDPERMARAALGNEVAGLPDAYPPDYPRSRLLDPGEIEMAPEPLPPEPQVAANPPIPRSKPFRPDQPTIDVPELPEPKQIPPMPTEVTTVARDPVVQRAQQILASGARIREGDEKIILEAQRRVQDAIAAASQSKRVKGGKQRERESERDFSGISYNAPGTAQPQRGKGKAKPAVDFGDIRYGPVPSAEDLEQRSANRYAGKGKNKGKSRRYQPIGFSKIAYGAPGSWRAEHGLPANYGRPDVIDPRIPKPSFLQKVAGGVGNIIDDIF